MKVFVESWKKGLSLLFLSLFVSFALLGLGCGAILDSPYGDNSEKREVGVGYCYKNSDCLEGQICYEGYCRALPSGDDVLVSVQFLPPQNYSIKSSGKILGKQQLIGVSLREINNRSLVLKNTFIISGRIRTVRRKIPVSAKLIFRKRSYIAGQQLVWSAVTDPRPGRLGFFRHQLTVGDYQVEIWPGDGVTPPYRIPRLRVDKDRDLEIVLPEQEDYLTLEGILSYRDGSWYRPFQRYELVLQAFNLDGLAISQSYRLRGIEFQLKISKGEIPHTLKIFSLSKTPKIPEISLPIRELVERAVGGRREGKVVRLGKVAVIPKLSPVWVSGEVKARSRDGGQLISNVKLRFTGEIDLGTWNSTLLKGYYSVYAQSDENGRYRVELLPGRYQIEVFPPPSSDRSKAIIYLKEPILRDRVINIELLSKRKVVGKVCLGKSRQKCERYLSNVQVEARWRSSLALHLPQKLPSLRSMSYSKSVLSSSDGWFELFLDPGYYDFIFTPPPGSGGAKIVERGVKVEIDSGSPQILKDIIIPTPHYYVGQVLDPDRFPISNLGVELYLYTPQKKGPALLLGKAVTNSQGFFSIPYIIPDSE